ncbi:hypothetical protein BDR03DRAFT_1007170 [Suillus americanus]|nr:hypothetical protein BDR03DRAFT_1007170 [Suillus americanus]
MVPHINLDTEEAPAPHPKQVAVPSVKQPLGPPITIDADSANEDEIQLEGPCTNKRLIKGRKPVVQSAQCSDVKDADLAQSAAPNEDEDEDEDSLPSMKPPKKQQKKVQPLPNTDSVDTEGFLTDIEVMDVDEPLKP